MTKTLIGLTEIVEINGRKFRARIDTGANRSSIDKRLAMKLNLGPAIKTTTVKSQHGRSVRPVIKGSVAIGGRRFRATFTLADRNHMSFQILIGRNILKKGFLIDTTK